MLYHLMYKVLTSINGGDGVESRVKGPGGGCLGSSSNVGRMPRVSLRRGLLYLAAITTASLLLLGVQQQQPQAWMPSGLPPSLQRRGLNIHPNQVGLDHPVLEQQIEEGDQSGAGKDDTQHHQNDPDTAVSASDIKPSGSLSDSALGDSANLRPEPLLSVNLTILPPERRPWYLKGGELRPEMPQDSEQWLRTSRLWPDEDSDDRIIDQLMFRPPMPPGLEDIPDPSSADGKVPLPYKKILMYNGMNSWGLRAGRGQFLKLKCPVDTCVLTGSRSEINSADAIMFKDHFSMPPHKRDPRQTWVMFMLECPLHTQHFSNRNVFNWTATYRHDSDIVAPYEKWVYYDDNIRQRPQEINYSANKTKQVAWFVSNCGARNNRLQYAKELGKYIGVDIYGACGSQRCPRSNSGKCFEMLNNDYKFYLAFENSNCRDYISEKFFVNGLRGLPKQKSHHILPIVMGAHPDDYRRAAPEKSYIHVDDFESPKDLAAFLHMLDKNDDLYNEYFRWKGTGEFINTYFMCRLCSMLHDEGHQQHYEDINLWWRGTGTCINGSWRKYDKLKKEEMEKRKQRQIETDKNEH
ncbi:unnamed protein product, partial [Meganyctiphanes norvegica]